MLERIWSGWRASYIGARAVDGDASTATGDAGADRADHDQHGSVFTQLLASEAPDEETHVVHRGEHVFTVLNIHPYTTGHLLVVPYREVPDLADLTAEETTE
ncbi:MAG: HIT domain-containing protein, partial [Actinomycetota bacterium]